MRRRTSFAATFVVTLASCGGSAKEPTGPTPPPPPDNDRPAPREPDASDTHWMVSQGFEPGQCQARIEDHCPEGASCNPPPPSRYPCPADLNPDGHLDVYQHPNDKTCFTRIMKMPDMSCPKGAMCNPPPPHMVEHPIDCPTD